MVHSVTSRPDLRVLLGQGLWRVRLAGLRRLGGLGVILGIRCREEARTRGFAAPAFAGCAFVGMYD